MFETLTEWLGVLAAPPVLFVLLAAVALSSACLVTPLSGWNYLISDGRHCVNGSLIH